MALIMNKVHLIRLLVILAVMSVLLGCMGLFGFGWGIMVCAFLFAIIFLVAWMIIVLKKVILE